MSLDPSRLIHAHLILATSLAELELPEITAEIYQKPLDFLKLFANGEYYKIINDELINRLLQTHRTLLHDDSKTFNEAVAQFASTIVDNSNEQISLFIAIAFLQLFIQHNFTGPQSPLDSFHFFFSNTAFTKEQIQLNASKALGGYGQSAYQDSQDPIFLLISLHLLEILSHAEKSLLAQTYQSSDEIIDEESNQIDINEPILAATNWWRSRAIQVQLSLFQEFSGPHISVVSSIYNSSLPKALCANLEQDLVKKISILFYLEKANNLIQSNMEHLALPNLIQAQKLSGFEFVMTGARAKRTQFQQTSYSSLIILAKSTYFNSNNPSASSNTPETFELNSDLLLEKPQFDSVGTEPLDDQFHKKQKLDLQEINYNELLPVSLRQEYIPKSLQELDPNDQPNLSDFDNLQLLLRVYTLRQTSPAKNPLVDQELLSLVSRVLYQRSTTSINYTIFARSLWERSIIETTKARTIERGILQMQSLIEEIGLKITKRFIPTAKEDESTENKVSNERLRYIYQLPLAPRWSLDIQLAEKYLSLGIVKSAIEIYERLHFQVDVALCYASLGEEAKAEKIIRDHIATSPDDARAISILGDLTSNPELWEKAWDIGKYAKAKFALGKYYYYPPPNSGLERNTELAIKHIHEGLTINPINNEQWFFYGCLGLESEQFNLAAEAFSRCVALDDTNSSAWANLATSLLKLNKVKEAFSALKKATSADDKRSWRMWENYLIVAAKLGEWTEVLVACKKLVQFRKDSSGEGSIDIPIVEKLVEILTSEPYDEDNLTFFQKSTIEFVTVTIPSVINSSSRLWRIIAKVELWRKKPWLSLECHEKAFRAMLHNVELETNEAVWNETVEACEDLVAAYESLGELPGKHGAGDLVCKDWKYKCRQTIKSLMSKTRMSWEDTEGWDRLNELKENI